VLNALDATFGDRTEFATCAYPKFRVNLVVGHNLALKDVTGEEVVVHRFGDDSCYGCVGEFDKSVVLGSTGL
jgi:hypothetical protein